MEVHQLKYFVAVAEEGNFSRAAERMFVAQPSLSQQIHKLEAEVGQRLFDRLKRKATLTEAGAGLLPFARKILNDLNDAQHFVSDVKKEPAGPVRVGAIATIAPYVMRALMKGCAEEFPKVDLQIVEDVTENLVRLNDDGAIDLAIISTCKPSATMHVEPCATENLLLALPDTHRLAGEKEIVWTKLRHERILMLHESHCLSHQIRRWCEQRKMRTVDTTTVLQLRTMLELVAAARGVCFVPEMAVRQERAAGCVFAKVRGNPPRREINILRNNSRYQTKSVSAVSGLVREVLCKTVGKN
jgi:LysR family transcriptional regulator, hydrogen peroxide-inducible genes activator